MPLGNERNARAAAAAAVVTRVGLRVVRMLSVGEAQLLVGFC